jgi:uncharacterized protein YbjQ (UPF0145 family)
MGNLPANSMSFPHHAGAITVSTRSDPPDDFVVVQDLGIVTANSTSFTRTNGRERECMLQVLELARLECQNLGGNCVLGTHFDIKQFGESVTLMVYSLTGMACVVTKRAANPSTPGVPAQVPAVDTDPSVLIATATVIDDTIGKG